ncbi:MAG: MBL fold metallo-hydrolase, partial [Acidimicrobiales bacterium]
HLHFDHILGLPFFGPLRHEDSVFDVYGPRQSEGDLCGVLGQVVRPPFFPVPLQRLLSELRFHDVTDNHRFAIGDAQIRARVVRHPGVTLGYRIEADGQSVAYLPDHQQPGEGETCDDGALDLCADVDVLVHDAQYTDVELSHKHDWGHSTVDFAVELARRSRARHLVLFHHDPSHDDAALDDMLERAQKLAAPHGVEVSSAREGENFRLGHL